MNMKKNYFGILVIIFAFIACSDSKDDNKQEPDTSDDFLLKSVLYNGEEITEDFEVNVTSDTKATFKLEIENGTPDQLVWLLNEEVIAEGADQLELIGRSGELYVAYNNKEGADTRALRNSNSKLKKVATLTGSYKEGVFAYSTNPEFSSDVSNYISFISNKLETPDTENILLKNNPSMEKTLDALGSYADLNIFNNKLYILKTGMNEEENNLHYTMFVADAQTLKVLAAYPVPAIQVAKFAMLDADTFFGWSYRDNCLVKGNLRTNEWDTNYSLIDGEEFMSGKILNTRLFRSKNLVAFAYGSQLLVLNSSGDIVKKIEDVFDGRRILAIIKDSKGKNNIKVIAEAKQEDTDDIYSDYVDVEKYPAQIYTFDAEFNLIKTVDHKLKFTNQGGVVVTEKRGFSVVYVQSDANYQGLAVTNSYLKEEFYYLKNNEYSIAVYKLGEDGVSQRMFDFSTEVGMANVSLQPCTDKQNHLIVPVIGAGDRQVHIYDLKNDNSFKGMLQILNYYPISVLGVGPHTQIK